MKKILTLIIVALLCYGCPGLEPGDYWEFIFENNSPHDVTVMLDLEDVDGKLVPSTSWSQDILSNFFEVESGRHLSYTFDPQYIEYQMGDVISVFVFSPDTLAKYTWSQIKADKNYLKRYEYVINWVEYITYP